MFHEFGLIRRLLRGASSVTAVTESYLSWGLNYARREKTDLDRAERIRVGLRALLDINTSVDILVYTREEVDEKKNHPSTLTYKVLTRGVKLYEAA